jgi:hypothetical protein
MATLQFLNGRRYSHASLEITIKKLTAQGSQLSEIFIDIDSIDYGDQLEMVLVRGTNRGPIGITAGDYEADDVNVSLGKSTFQVGIVESIGDGWLGSELNYTVTYADDGEPLITDRIRCFITSGKDSSAAGPDNVKVKMGHKALWVSRNNVMPIKNMIK